MRSAQIFSLIILQILFLIIYLHYCILHLGFYRNYWPIYTAPKSMSSGSYGNNEKSISGLALGSNHTEHYFMHFFEKTNLKLGKQKLLPYFMCIHILKIIFWAGLKDKAVKYMGVWATAKGLYRSSNSGRRPCSDVRKLTRNLISFSRNNIEF